MSRPSKKLKVAVTGAHTDLGRLLLPRLTTDPRVREVVVLDQVKPAGVNAVFRRIVLTDPRSDSAVAQAFEQERPNVVYHLASAGARVHRSDFAHELDVMGSMHIIAAIARLHGLSNRDGATDENHRFERLILPSSTALYGARPTTPAMCREEEALGGCPGSRFINDKIEVERQFAQFAQQHPGIDVVVLRLAPVVGPTSDNPVTRLLRTRFIPTLMGWDPLWQALHENDAAEALQRALVCPRGTYNVAAPGVMPWSSMVKQAGGRVVPMPSTLLQVVTSALESVGRTSVSHPLVAYLKYSLVADAERAATALGFLPRYSMAEALSSL